MKGYIYARESSADTTNAPSIKGQVGLGKKVLQEKGHSLIATFEDNGFSGGSWERPALDKLRTAINYGGSDFVWVFAQDRLARDTELFLNLLRTFKEKNIKLFYGSAFSEITMDNAGDTLKHTVIAAADTMFRQSTGDKVKATYQHKKKLAEETGKRVQWGRRSAPQHLVDMAIKLKKENPKAGCRIIANMLPPYKYKLKNGQETPTRNFVSHTWVANILKQNSDKLNEQPPSTSTSCEPVK